MSKKRWLIIVAVVVAVVLLAILFDTMLATHQPVIASLEAEPEGVIPSGSCQIVCIASDRDGDELSYNWSASGGEITGEGATVTWTAPNSVGSYNVTVIVFNSRGGADTDSVTITVRANRPPTINGLVADADWTLRSGSISVTCDASDPDDDELSYEWTITGGDISGTGAVVNWTAPQEVGTYNITVVVKDGYGGEDRGMLPLSVNLDTPPAIEKLCVTPEGHRYLRDSSTPGCDYDVWKNKDYNIECVASGTDELIYEWSCDDGQISEVSGGGSKITWAAPNKQSTNTVSVDVTVTVIVSDAAGNSVGENIVFHVPTCTCGSWGLELGCK